MVGFCRRPDIGHCRRRASFVAECSPLNSEKQKGRGASAARGFHRYAKSRQATSSRCRLASQRRDGGGHHRSKRGPSSAPISVHSTIALQKVAIGSRISIEASHHKLLQLGLVFGHVQRVSLGFHS